MKNYRLIAAFFVFILLLVPIGFRRYFAALLDGEIQSHVLHFHVIVMTIWCLMLIAQPILINIKQHNFHRMLGKASYWLVPIIILSIWLVIRHSFFRMEEHLTLEDNLAQIFFPFSQMILFGGFYSLAILNKTKPPVHMRYIIVSSVSLLGPTIGRINFSSAGLGSIDMDLWVMNLTLIGFIIYDQLKKLKSQPYYIGLMTYALMNWAYYSFSSTELWQIAARKLLVL
ncbi:hypothetical protein [Ekhidna sp.]|uniref:hypothetical protein n=1 Tax=Ekhidna sp. TaxID=2608089 RepID=UPI0032ED1888